MTQRKRDLIAAIVGVCLLVIFVVYQYNFWGVIAGYDKVREYIFVTGLLYGISKLALRWKNQGQPPTPPKGRFYSPLGDSLL